MPRFSFQVGGVAFHLEGDQGIIGYIEFLYRAFPAPAAEAAIVTFNWNEGQLTWRVGSRPARLLFASDPRQRPAITTTLIARIMTELESARLILHGNALIQRGNNHPLLLVGESGAGKTTLTLKLLDDPAAWVPFAEDVLLLEAEKRVLLPFPRAIALREASPELSHAAYFEHGSKRLVENRPEHTQAVSLDGATVVLLKQQTGDTREIPTADVVWTSYGTDELEAELRNSGLPLERWGLVDGLACFEYQRVLTAGERQTQSETFERHGAMILRTMSRREKSWRGFRRPEQPVCRRLDSAEGIRLCLPHLVRPSAAFAAQPAGKLFLLLSGALARSRFLLLVPGGSPEDSACCIREAAAE